MTAESLDIKVNNCPNCRAANRPGANYCAACGWKLSIPQSGAALSTHDLQTKPLSRAPRHEQAAAEMNGTDIGRDRPQGQPAPATHTGSAAFKVFQCGFRSDVGRQRRQNEDSLLVFTFARLPYVWNILIVADGMGGHEHGEIASRLLTDVVARRLAREWLNGDGDQTLDLIDHQALLDESIKAGNRAVYDHAQKTGTDMGTTVVAALVAGNDAYIAHVGDSRAYLIDEGGIYRITTDHSLVEQLIAAGEITRQQARHHPHAHVILRTIGDGPDVEVEHNRVRLDQGSRLLLCSDGLTGMVSDERIQAIVLAASSPQAACDMLVTEANQAGGEDNISVITIWPEA